MCIPHKTSEVTHEFRNFSEYSEIYSSPFSPIPTVANMPGTADLKIRLGFSSASDSCEYARNRCRQGANQPRLLQIPPKVLPSWIKSTVTVALSRAYSLTKKYGSSLEVNSQACGGVFQYVIDSVLRLDAIDLGIIEIRVAGLVSGIFIQHCVR